MSSPESGKYMIEQYAYGHCNQNAFKLADQKIIADLGFGSPSTLFQHSVFETEVSPEMDQRRNKIFEDVKAG
jgi:spermidine/putrescine transport system substrate-binding protein